MEQQPAPSTSEPMEDDLDNDNKRKRKLSSSSSSDSIASVDSTHSDWQTVKATTKKEVKMHDDDHHHRPVGRRRKRNRVTIRLPKQRTKAEKATKKPTQQTANDTQNWTKTARRPPPRKHHKKTEPLPIFKDHPVTIEEEAGPSTTSLRSLNWKMNDIPRGMIGTVRSIKPVTFNKILVGCQSKLQQDRLTKIKKIGETSVKCSIPVPTVIGIVRGVPHHVSMDEFKDKMESPHQIMKTTVST
ncbi:hypothetical protein ACOMHN_057625 [Nucella lapillus]